MCDNTEKIGHMQAIVLNNIPWGDRRKGCCASIASAKLPETIQASGDPAETAIPRD